MSLRILVTDGLAESGFELLRGQAEVVQSQTLEALGTVDALVVRSRTKVTEHVLAKAVPRLRVVGRAGVGVDNIDLAAARAHGVTVVNAPQATSSSVAELVLGLMISLARRIPWADTTTRKGEWRKKELHGSQLQGKTLGIIGVGRIGTALAARAAALGMQVIGYDSELAPETIRQRGPEPVGFEPLLAQADFISLHVPLTDDTRGMIDRLALAKTKPGLFLINTARGGVVDESALLEALNSGLVAGAALDVYAQEPPGDNPLLSHPNVVLTPHIGAQTREAQEQASLDICEEVIAALRGEPLRWRVA